MNRNNNIDMHEYSMNQWLRDKLFCTMKWTIMKYTFAAQSLDLICCSYGSGTTDVWQNHSATQSHQLLDCILRLQRETILLSHQWTCMVLFRLTACMLILELSDWRYIYDWDKRNKSQEHHCTCCCTRILESINKSVDLRTPWSNWIHRCRKGGSPQLRRNTHVLRSKWWQHDVKSMSWQQYRLLGFGVRYWFILVNFRRN